MENAIKTTNAKIFYGDLKVTVQEFLEQDPERAAKTNGLLIKQGLEKAKAQKGSSKYDDAWQDLKESGLVDLYESEAKKREERFKKLPLDFVIELAAGIIEGTSREYAEAIRNRDERLQGEIESFAKSSWCDELTQGRKEIYQKTLVEIKKRVLKELKNKNCKPLDKAESL